MAAAIALKYFGLEKVMLADVSDVLNIMKSGRWNIESIITHEFSIDDISKAIEMAARSDRAFNVVIKFGE